MNEKPCRHMDGLLNRAIDGKLRGFAKWYAWAHAARCPKCTRFLRSLEAMVLSLRKRRDEETDPAAISRLAKRVSECAPPA